MGRDDDVISNAKHRWETLLKRGAEVLPVYNVSKIDRWKNTHLKVLIQTLQVTRNR